MQSIMFQQNLMIFQLKVIEVQKKALLTRLYVMIAHRHKKDGCKAFIDFGNRKAGKEERLFSV